LLPSLSLSQLVINAESAGARHDDEHETAQYRDSLDEFVAHQFAEVKRLLVDDGNGPEGVGDDGADGVEAHDEEGAELSLEADD